MVIFFSPSTTISKAAGAVFVNSPQKCCERSQGQVPPPPRAGPDSMLFVSVALVQINGTAWRFHLEIQKHLVTEGTPAQPALQVGQAGALGQNNATVSSLDKESHSLTTNRGCGHPGCVVCRTCRKHPQNETGLIQPRGYEK